jgi:hypothetical protein
MNQHCASWAHQHGGRVSCVRDWLTTGTLLLVLIACGATDVRAQSMPTGWSGANIGNPPLAGSASHTGGVFTIEGSGADIWGTSDQLFFAYRQASGDVDIVARVISVENTHRWAKAGVMIRASLNGNSAHASMFVTPGMGLSFQRRPATAAASESTAGPMAAAPAWVKLERRGQTITSYSSMNGTSWTRVGSQTLTLPSTFYVGLADSSHNTAALATATSSPCSPLAAFRCRRCRPGGTAPTSACRSFRAPGRRVVERSRSADRGGISGDPQTSSSSRIGRRPATWT